VRWIVIIAIALGALIAAAVWVLRLPDTQVIESVRSPDRQWIARVEYEAFGNSFGPVFYAVSLRPSTGWLAAFPETRHSCATTQPAIP
jgi:hypothetical protein